MGAKNLTWPGTAMSTYYRPASDAVIVTCYATAPRGQRRPIETALSIQQARRLANDILELARARDEEVTKRLAARHARKDP